MLMDLRYQAMALTTPGLGGCSALEERGLWRCAGTLIGRSGDETVQEDTSQRLPSQNEDSLGLPTGKTRPHQDNPNRLGLITELFPSGSHGS